MSSAPVSAHKKTPAPSEDAKRPPRGYISTEFMEIALNYIGKLEKMVYDTLESKEHKTSGATSAYAGAWDTASEKDVAMWHMSKAKNVLKAMGMDFKYLIDIDIHINKARLMANDDPVFDKAKELPTLKLQGGMDQGQKKFPVAKRQGANAQGNYPVKLTPQQLKEGILQEDRNTRQNMEKTAFGGEVKAVNQQTFPLITTPDKFLAVLTAFRKNSGEQFLHQQGFSTLLEKFSLSLPNTTPKQSIVYQRQSPFYNLSQKVRQRKQDDLKQFKLCLTHADQYIEYIDDFLGKQGEDGKYSGFQGCWVKSFRQVLKQYANNPPTQKFFGDHMKIQRDFIMKTMGCIKRQCEEAKVISAREIKLLEEWLKTTMSDEQKQYLAKLAKEEYGDPNYWKAGTKFFITDPFNNPPLLNLVMVKIDKLNRTKGGSWVRYYEVIGPDTNHEEWNKCRNTKFKGEQFPAENVEEQKQVEPTDEELLQA